MKWPTSPIRIFNSILALATPKVPFHFSFWFLLCSLWEGPTPARAWLEIQYSPCSGELRHSSCWNTRMERMLKSCIPFMKIVFILPCSLGRVDLCLNIVCIKLRILSSIHPNFRSCDCRWAMPKLWALAWFGRWVFRVICWGHVKGVWLLMR